MGQPVNYLLGDQAQTLGGDPEVYRQQLIQQEQARIGALPAQNQLGAQLGGLLGRGIGNLTQGRGFMEVTNPVLQKLTTIQSIYDTSIKESDPNDPMSFYTTLQKNFSTAGLGRQAMMAQVEANKFKGVDIKNKKELTDLYTSNPGELDSAIQRATQAGDTKSIENLTTLKTTIEKKRDLELAKETAQIGLIGAQTEQARAVAQRQITDIESGKYDWKVINDITGTPVSMAKIDKKTGETTYEPIPEAAIARPGAKPPAGATSSSGAGKPSLRFNPATGGFDPVGK
jgi:hypothetical protein